MKAVIYSLFILLLVALFSTISLAKIRYAEQGDMDYGYKLLLIANTLSLECALTFPKRYHLQADMTKATLGTKAEWRNGDVVNGTTQLLAIRTDDNLVAFTADATGGKSDYTEDDTDVEVSTLLFIQYESLMSEPSEDDNTKITLKCKSYTTQQQKDDALYDDLELIFIGSGYNNIYLEKGSHDMKLDLGHVPGKPNSRVLHGYSFENQTLGIRSRNTVGFELMSISHEHGYIKPIFRFDESTASCYLDDEEKSKFVFYRGPGEGFLDMEYPVGKEAVVGSKLSVRCEGVIMEAENSVVWDRDYMMVTVFVWSLRDRYFNFWPQVSSTVVSKIGTVIVALVSFVCFAVM